MPMAVQTVNGPNTAVILVNFSNPEHGCIADLRMLAPGEITPFFRGHAAKINPGDLVLAHDMRSIAGYIEFVKFAPFRGSNLQGNWTNKGHALWVMGPFYEFLNPVAFSATDQPPHWWGHVNAPTLSTPTFMAVKAQCATARPRQAGKQTRK